MFCGECKDSEGSTIWGWRWRWREAGQGTDTLRVGEWEEGVGVDGRGRGVGASDSEGRLIQSQCTKTKGQMQERWPSEEEEARFRSEGLGILQFEIRSGSLKQGRLLTAKEKLEGGCKNGNKESAQLTLLVQAYLTRRPKMCVCIMINCRGRLTTKGTKGKASL